MALRPLPPDTRSRLSRRRRRARLRARALAVVLAGAGLVCVAFGVRADPAPASAARARRAAKSAGTALWSPRRVPALFVDAVAVGRLRQQLGVVIAPVDACVAVNDRSRPVARINSGRPLAGASTQKILVAAAALSVLGSTHRFATRAMTEGTQQGSRLAGDVFVVGGGDPLLTTATDPSPVATRLSDLADAIARAGITRIDGAIVGDDSRYDRERTVADWTPDEIAEGSSGALGALIVNGGYADDNTPATDPALETVQHLADLLAARGVEISGGVRDTDTVTPRGAREIARVESPRLSAIVEEMLRESNNETAELLTRELGVARGDAGTTAAGTQEVRIALAHLGVPVTDVDLRDGSGLAPSDRVTCDALLRVLDLGARRPLMAIDDGLPVAGQSGTLATRFSGTSLAGRLRAKTGHINGVVGLAGVIDPTEIDAGEIDAGEIDAGPTNPGPRFAFVANGTFSTDAGALLQDEIAAIIGAYPDAPTPAELVPAPRPTR